VLGQVQQQWQLFVEPPEPASSSASLDLDDNEFASASVGWGIQLATIGAIVAVIASFLARRDSPSGADLAEEPNAGPHRP